MSQVKHMHFPTKITFCGCALLEIKFTALFFFFFFQKSAKVCTSEAIAPSQLLPSGQESCDLFFFKRAQKCAPPRQLL